MIPVHDSGFSSVYIKRAACCSLSSKFTCDATSTFLGNVTPDNLPRASDNVYSEDKHVTTALAASSYIYKTRDSYLQLQIYNCPDSKHFTQLVIHSRI